MDKSKIIAKIQAMLRLQEQTSFEHEADAASKLIDKLCKEYGVSVEDAKQAIIEDEVLKEFKRADYAYTFIVNAVAKYYDAKAYIQRQGNRTNFVKIIGSEAQRIQVQLYSEYLLEIMDREADVAFSAEKIIASLHGRTADRTFKMNFRKGFAVKIAKRLEEMKLEQNREHEDKQAVQESIKLIKFCKGTKVRGPLGSGATAGISAAGEVSLSSQVSSRQQKCLTGF